jgi:8-oxo-dGTP pyrophosphatase MutT (NUDIX family)
MSSRGYHSFAGGKPPKAKQAAHLFLRVGYYKKKVLLLKHKGSNLWGTPGGEVDGRETFIDAMKREFREETGIDLPSLASTKWVDVYGGSTRIFVAEMKGNPKISSLLPATSDTHGKLNTRETSAWEAVPIEDLERRTDLRGGVMTGFGAAKKEGFFK